MTKSLYNLPSTLKTPLSKAKHLGSAHSGTTHFIRQRLTAIFLIPCVFWFVYMLVSIAHTPLKMVTILSGSVLNISIAVFFVGTVLYHSYLGLQMILEDYVHSRGKLILSLVLVKTFCIITFISFVLAMVASISTFSAAAVFWHLVLGKVH